MRDRSRPYRRSPIHVGVLVACALALGSDLPTSAQVTTNITNSVPGGPSAPGNLGTVITSSGTTTTITGGTRPSNGPNLFHSFGNFNVPTNNIANFLNSGSIDPANPNVMLPSGLPTSNILGRINGGNPSSIFGMIQTNSPGGFPLPTGQAP